MNDSSELIISAMDLEPTAVVYITYEQTLSDLDNLANWFIHYHPYFVDGDIKGDLYHVLDYFMENLSHYLFINRCDSKEGPLKDSVLAYIMANHASEENWIRYINETNPDFYIDPSNGEDNVNWCANCGQNETVPTSSICYRCIMELPPESPYLCQIVSCSRPSIVTDGRPECFCSDHINDH